MVGSVSLSFKFCTRANSAVALLNCPPRRCASPLHSLDLCPTPPLRSRQHCSSRSPAKSGIAQTLHPQTLETPVTVVRILHSCKLCSSSKCTPPRLHLNTLVCTRITTHSHGRHSHTAARFTITSPLLVRTLHTRSNSDEPVRVLHTRTTDSNSAP